MDGKKGTLKNDEKKGIRRNADPHCEVGRLGFEPGMTEPKPVVLPLHHRPESGAKVVKIWHSAKFLPPYLISR